jgi:hypothetical protein
MIGSYLSPPSPCDYQSFGSIAFGLISWPSARFARAAAGRVSELRLPGTARCPRKRPRGDGGGAPPGVMPPATLAQRARGAAPAAGPKPKKPWRRQAHRGPAPLPLRALAWFLALPSNILLLCVAAGWYVGVVWLAPGTPSGWIHSMAYSIVVLSFFGAFVACVLSTWLRG